MPGYRLLFAVFLGLLISSFETPAQTTSKRAPDYNFFDTRMGQREQRRAPGEGAIELARPPEQRSVRARSSVTHSPTAPAAGGLEAIARNELARQGGPLGPIALSVYDFPLEARYESKTAGLTHFVFRPHYAGIPYFDSAVQVHVDAAGRIWQTHAPPMLPPPVDLAMALRATDATAAAMQALAPGTELDLTIIAPETGTDHRTTLAAPALRSPVPAGLVWFAIDEISRLAWQLYLDIAPGRTYSVAVDANSSEILFSENLTREVDPRGTVFAAPSPAQPNKGPRTSEPFTGWPLSAGGCPSDVYPEAFRSGPLTNHCWVTDTETLGNNANVCLDLTGNNTCGGRAASPAAQFDFLFTNAYVLTGDASPDRAAALTNAFYWANTLHDWLYRLGFSEAAGNFQADNFGLGGAGGDPLQVDVQDAAVVGAASFITPPDGVSPRLQLGLLASLRRDASFDGDVIVHEYVHGLTTRLVGGPGNVNTLPLWQSGALGEGWSDAYAASFTNDPVVGEYVTGNPTSGLRTVRYDNSPYTFGRFGTLFLKVVPGTGGLNLAMPQVHRDGEIWATVLWDIRGLVGQTNFEQLMTTALALTPGRPSMLEARDALLQAAQAMGLGGANACGLWNLFAARGFGFSAALNPIEPGQQNDTALSVFEARDTPGICGGSTLALNTILEEDAESVSAAWSATGLWHRTTRRAASGLYSWWFGQELTGTYDTGSRAQGDLVSGPIDLTASTEATVEWDQLFEGEGFGSQVSLGVGSAGAYLNADSGRLLVSIDNGASWQTISTLAHNSPADTFVHYRVNLKRFTGRIIRLAFSFDTFDNQSNQQEGWFLDNVRVSALIPAVPALQVTPAALSFSGTAGGSEPASQLLAITNAGSGTLNWTAAVVQGTAWLQVLPASGVENANPTVSVFAAGMHPGVHIGTIQVGSAGAQNSPRLINVTLTVTASAGPAMAWPFEELSSGGGVIIADSSGHSRHGATIGYGTIPAPGVAGNARLLNGYSDSIEVPLPPASTPPSFTFRTWVRLSAYPASNYGIIAASYGGNSKGWFLAVTNEGKVTFLGARTPNVTRWLFSSLPLALERWYSVSATYDRPAGVAALYLDGVLQAQTTLADLELETTRPLTFGRSSWHNGYYLNFSIDATEIYPVARTAGEVAADFATFTPPAATPNPLQSFEWNFSQQALDVSGNGHHGTLQGTQAIAGVQGQARRLNGSGDAITVAASHRFTPSRFTLRLWVRLPSYPSNFGILAANYGGDYQGWFVGVRSDGRLIVSQSHLPASARWTVSNTPLALSRWYHITITFDGWLRQLNIYVDGVLDRQDILLGLTPRVGGAFTAGKSSWHNGYYLACDIDELRLTPRVLQPSEVQNDFLSFPGM